MMKSPTKRLLTSIVLFCFSLNANAQSWEIESPDYKTRISVTLSDGALTYECGYQKTAPGWEIEASGYKPVIKSSRLGVITQQQDFTKGLTFESVTPQESYSFPYELVTGKKRQLDNHYTEKKLVFKNAKGSPFEIIIRAYGEGVAFRYRFPGNEGSYTVVDEITEFSVSSQGKAWMIPYSPVGKWSPGYEEDYVKEMNIGEKSPLDPGWAFPLLFDTTDHWILIGESGMDGNYFASHVEANCEDGRYRIRIPEEDETYGVHPQSSTAQLPFHSPWRAIMFADNPGKIIENNLITHLAPEPQNTDTSWIKPGPSTWSWLFDKSSQTDYDRIVPFIDLTAELGWPYTLIDADWHLMKNGNIEEVVSYAEKKGVGILVWYNSGGQHNKVKPIGPADRMHQSEVRRKEMAWMQRIGIKGIKVDFMQSDKQGLMQLYEDILKDASEFELLVNFHGATLPRGWQKTWPNLMTMEAVKGGEQLWSQDFANQVPSHNTILPFSRNVVGPMDYTPFTFQGVSPEIATVTTHAHELATTVLFESGIQHVSETVEHFEMLPYYVWRFLKQLPTVWDDTKFISGYPGKDVIIARRSGNKWIVTGINGEEKEKVVTIDLGFLKNRSYTAEIIHDGDSKTTFSHKKSTLTAQSQIQLTFAANGGFVVVLEEI